MRISPKKFFEGQNIMKDNIGKLGEHTAELYLCANNYTIINKNYTTRFGEIDIIASNDKYLVFAEVKTRSQNPMVSGAQAVDTQKQQRLRTTAELWLSENPTELQPRFDVIEVEYDENRRFKVKNYIINAF